MRHRILPWEETFTAGAAHVKRGLSRHVQRTLSHDNVLLLCFMIDVFSPYGRVIVKFSQKRFGTDPFFLKFRVKNLDYLIGLNRAKYEHFSTSRRCLNLKTQKINPLEHMLNMEEDLQSLFVLHVTWCAQLYSLAATPQPNPPPLPHPPALGLVYEGAIGWHLSVTPCPWPSNIKDATPLFQSSELVENFDTFRYWCCVWLQLLYKNIRNRIRWVVFGLSQDGICRFFWKSQPE